MQNLDFRLKSVRGIMVIYSKNSRLIAVERVLVDKVVQVYVNQVLHLEINSVILKRFGEEG